MFVHKKRYRILKFDIKLTKRILNAIQEHESHYLLVSDILDIVKSDYEEIEKEDFKDLFYGHLFLLKDNDVIQEVLGENLGISYTINRKITKAACFIRLTSKGYDYIKILNKDGIVEKFKKYTLTESLKVGEYILLKGVEQFLNMC